METITLYIPKEDLPLIKIAIVQFNEHISSSHAVLVSEESDEYLDVADMLRITLLVTDAYTIFLLGRIVGMGEAETNKL